jgi:hypothetical protein
LPSDRWETIESEQVLLGLVELEVDDTLTLLDRSRWSVEGDVEMPVDALIGPMLWLKPPRAEQRPRASD